MAKQSSFLKLEGTIGDVTFTKTQDGYLAKQKTTINASRIASDPRFERTRENNLEFGRAGKAVKLLRTALHSVIQAGKDSKLTDRLTKEMMKVIKADATSIRGQRNVIDGESELLFGFNFNANAALTSILFASYTATINRVTGALTVNVPSLVPNKDVAVPEGTTHFALVSAGAEIDFENGVYTEASTSSGVLPWDDNDAGPVTLTNMVTANSTHPLFLLFGIQFYQQVNGTNYTLNNNAFNPLAMVKVSGV